ncbi:MAG: hypothetical protein NTY37_10095 [Methanothrix sp.]|nr:hypothetical protein [Methanothrix sp.]
MGESFARARHKAAGDRRGAVILGGGGRKTQKLQGASVTLAGPDPRAASSPPLTQGTVESHDP